MKSVLVPSLLLSSFCAAAAAADFYPTEEQTPANNPAVMHLFPEGGEVHGWISGLEDLEGQQVVFGDTGGGTATIGAGNRFHFKAGGDKSKTCTVSLGNLQRTITIPPAQADAPVAFFVIDRSVFRPNTELQFAAFLRQADADGKWRPLQRDSVEVEIESVSKNITVAKLQLAPDDFGRVTGSYTFAKADPLDDYRISVDGLGGSASVKVAEFRKAKVRLDIGSQRDGDTLTLKFRALDFLNKPVPASKLRFTARVVRKPLPAIDLWGLKPTSYPGWEDRDEHWYALTAEQQALIRSGVANPGGASQSQAVHTISEELEVGENGIVDFPLAVDPTWIQGHLLEIDGTLIDANNREQKASKSLPLGEESDETLVVEADSDELPAGQAFKVTARTSTDQPVTFVAFRLRHLPVQTLNAWQPQPNFFQSVDLFSSSSTLLLDPGLFIYPSVGRSGLRNYPNRTVNHAKAISREFLTLKPGQPVARAVAAGPAIHSASMSLAQPGAYVVQAITHDAAGRELRSETTVVVGPKKRANAVYLNLENDRLERGEALRGRVQSRFAGARVLLALRDGSGIRSLHPLTLKEGGAEFSIELPADLTLGCELTARYTDNHYTMHLARSRFLVAPPGAELEIASTVPDTVEPGDEIELQLSVNRKEEVDLVVSVYDQSLLGIAPERPVDGRSLFYADLRVEDDRVDAMLESYLGGLSLSSVAEELKLVFTDRGFTATPQGQKLATLAKAITAMFLDERTLRILLAWRGAPIQIETPNYRSHWQLKIGAEDYHVPLLELIRRNGERYPSHLEFQLIGEQLAINTRRIVNGIEQPLSYDPLIQTWYHEMTYSGYGIGGGGAELSWAGGLAVATPTSAPPPMLRTAFSPARRCCPTYRWPSTSRRWPSRSGSPLPPSAATSPTPHSSIRESAPLPMAKPR